MTPLSAPTSPQEIVGELLSVIERLTEILALETASLSHTATRNNDDFAATKTRIVVRYEMLLGALAVHPKPVLQLVPGFARIIPSVTQLNILASENAQAIERHLAATRHVLDIIARAARKASQPNFSYGTSRLGYGVHGNRGAAVAVNRVL